MVSPLQQSTPQQLSQLRKLTSQTPVIQPQSPDFELNRLRQESEQRQDPSWFLNAVLGVGVIAAGILASYFLLNGGVETFRQSLWQRLATFFLGH